MTHSLKGILSAFWQPTTSLRRFSSSSGSGSAFSSLRALSAFSTFLCCCFHGPSLSGTTSFLSQWKWRWYWCQCSCIKIFQMLSLASGGKIANQKYRGDEGKKWDCKVFEEITGTKLFLFVLHLQKCGFKVPEGIDRGTCQREECLGLQYLSNLRGILHRYDSLCAC